MERQEIAVGLLERAYGSSENVRKVILKFLRSNDSIRKSEDSTRTFYKMVNLVGGVSNLLTLKEDDLLIIFENIVKKAQGKIIMKRRLSQPQS